MNKQMKGSTPTMTPTRDQNSPLARHWKRYLKNREDLEARDFILLSYRPLVEKIAKNLMQKNPPTVERDDLVQSGMIGLQHALERYRDDQGALFSTFATPRVRGAILDEINSLDWTPRLVRERIKLVFRATEAHYKENQHPPTTEEIVQKIHEISDKTLTPEQVEEALHQATKTYVHAVDNATAVQHEENSRFDITSESNKGSSSDVEYTVIRKKFFEESVSDAINAVCTEDEKIVVVGVFYYEKTMKSIAEELGVPVSRVSNYKKRAVAKIKEELHRHGVTSVDHW